MRRRLRDLIGGRESRRPQWPNLIVAGTQKAGTTWLHRALAAHPDVEMSSPKELYFFGRADVDDPDQQARYREHFAMMSARYRGESSSSYFWRRSDAPTSPKPNDDVDAAHAIRRLLGHDVVVFVLLRSPVERAVAGANHQVTMGRMGVDDDIVDAEPRHGVVDLGFYGRHLDHWLDVLGGQVEPILFDDLEADPAGVLDQVGNRLELRMDDIPAEVRNEILQPTHTREQVRESQQVFDAPSFTVRPADVERLLEIYRSDIRRVEELLGRSLDAWTDLDALMAKLVSTE